MRATQRQQREIEEILISGVKTAVSARAPKYEYYSDEDSGASNPYMQIDLLTKEVEVLNDLSLKNTEKLLKLKDDFGKVLEWTAKGARVVEVKHNAGFSAMIIGNWCRANVKDKFTLIERDERSIVGLFMDPEDAIKFRLFYG